MLDIKKKKRRGKKMGQRQRFGGIIYLSKKHAYPRNVHQGQKPREGLMKDKNRIQYECMCPEEEEVPCFVEHDSRSGCERRPWRKWQSKTCPISEPSALWEYSHPIRESRNDQHLL